MAKYTIKEVQLNNKSRKGKYYYYKEKGQGGRYYKKKPRHYKGDIKTYKKIIKQSYTKKQSVVSLSKELQRERQKRVKAETKVKQQAKIIDQLLEELGRKVKRQTLTTKAIKKQGVNELIKRGIYEREIELKKLNNNTIKNVKKEIAKQMSKTTQGRKLLLKNINKTKTRFQYEITMKDEKGEILKTGYIVGKTIEEVVQKLNKTKPYKPIKTESYAGGSRLIQEEDEDFNWFISKIGKTKQVLLKIKYVKN